ncbi:Cullin family-domain-containing protein [Syncephalastrum racemosum]|uniref:Cullin family-domain-containing protein n=1 Tax=Syncephalastrum racemosum TaxID=13706 RepID=A0A1X2HF82_SYNRA|nr:Cullin family-domain-containing protein [Syncephalastrum racemosum]
MADPIAKRVKYDVQSPKSNNGVDQRVKVERVRLQQLNLNHQNLRVDRTKQRQPQQFSKLTLDRTVLLDAAHRSSRQILDLSLLEKDVADMLDNNEIRKRDTFEQKWEILSKHLQDVWNDQQTSYSVVPYEICEDLCRWDNADKLYENVVDNIKRRCLRLADHFAALAPKNREFLSVFVKSYLSFRSQLKTVCTMCSELDYRYAYPKKGQHLHDLSMELYRDTLFSVFCIRERLIANTYAIVRKERSRMMAANELLYQLMEMMQECHIYTLHFEPRLVAHIEENYENIAASILSESPNIRAYLDAADTMFKDEKDGHVSDYLPAETKEKILDIAWTQLYRAPLNRIIEKGAVKLLETNDMKTLRRLYVIAKDVELTSLQEALVSFIKIKCQPRLDKNADDGTLVSYLITFQRRLDLLFQDSFDNDVLLINRVRETFVALFQQRKDDIAEIFACYFDYRLKDVAQENNKLDVAVQLLRFVPGKDLFEAVYKHQMVKRLVNPVSSKSVSLKVEAQIVQKLSAVCDPEFVSAAERMLKDLENADKINQQIQLKRSAISVNVRVLAQSLWPTVQTSSARLPEELRPLQRQFEQAYLSKYKKQHLVWNHPASSCVLETRYQFPSHVIATIAQTSVLLLYNHKTTYTYAEIKSKTGMRSMELTRILQSLCMNRKTPNQPSLSGDNDRNSLLLKHPSNPHIHPTDEFTYNPNYTRSASRINIMNAIDTDTKEVQRKVVNEDVKQSRRNQMDAALVRVVKREKVLTLSDLLLSTTNALRFPVHDDELLSRIEDLAKKEFFTVDEDTVTYKQ